MKLNKKANVILVSLGAIALASSVIAGSTYALFTSESKANIAITAGKVDVSATIGDLETYSGVDLTGDPDTDVIEKTAVKGVFTNGGTAKISSDGTLELANVTPGDKATFKIEVSNKSNVTIKYRTIISYSNDDGLFSGLDLTVGDYQFDKTTYKSKWTKLEPSENINVASIDCIAVLPSDAGNEYQGKTCKINYSIEAVQGNAYTEDDKEDKFVTLSLSSEDEAKGTVAGGGSVKVGDDVTISASANEGYTFKGWYEGTALVSNANPYTFTVPSNDMTYVAKFYSEADELELKKKQGIIPVVDTASKTVTYGLYPQTAVSDTATVAALNELEAENNGWYLYNDEYYAKITANPCSKSYKFANNTKIVSGTEYWFKCELIKWNILSESEGTYSLLSSVLLDAHSYTDFYTKTDGNGHYTNNYEVSSIRSWLNKEFLNTAFNLENTRIQTVTVDNSASSSYEYLNQSNPYACNNTDDKVYLLSYKDYLNADYGFSTYDNLTDKAKQCKPTDYALANGIEIYTSSSYYGYGYYWTRSPRYNAYDKVYSVHAGGYLNYSSFSKSDDPHYGVRPGLTIKI